MLDQYCFHGYDRSRDTCPACDGTDYLDTHDISDRPLGNADLDTKS